MVPSGGTVRATIDLWGRQFCRSSSISLSAMIAAMELSRPREGGLSRGFSCWASATVHWKAPHWSFPLPHAAQPPGSAFLPLPPK